MISAQQAASKRGKTRPFGITLSLFTRLAVATRRCCSPRVSGRRPGEQRTADLITPSIPFQSIVHIYPSLQHLHTRRKLDVSPSSPRIDDPHLFFSRRRRSILHCLRDYNIRYLTQHSLRPFALSLRPLTQFPSSSKYPRSASLDSYNVRRSRSSSGSRRPPGHHLLGCGHPCTSLLSRIIGITLMPFCRTPMVPTPHPFIPRPSTVDPTNTPVSPRLTKPSDQPERSSDDEAMASRARSGPPVRSPPSKMLCRPRHPVLGLNLPALRPLMPGPALPRLPPLLLHRLGKPPRQPSLLLPRRHLRKPLLSLPALAPEPTTRALVWRGPMVIGKRKVSPDTLVNTSVTEPDGEFGSFGLMMGVIDIAVRIGTTHGVLRDAPRPMLSVLNSFP